MANKKNTIKKDNIPNNKKNNSINKEPSKIRNTIIMKILVVLGVIVLCVGIIYLMNYFFVEKSYLKINISTDKKLEFIDVEDTEELVTTQKYVSDLNYSMRYDTNKFSVFKYKHQDIYKYSENEKVLVVVEESGLPNSCSDASLDMQYNNCYLKVDNYTEEYYISTNGKTYKITIKLPNSNEYTSDLSSRIDYMLNSFEMNI